MSLLVSLLPRLYHRRAPGLMKSLGLIVFGPVGRRFDVTPCEAESPPGNGDTAAEGVEPDMMLDHRVWRESGRISQW